MSKKTCLWSAGMALLALSGWVIVTGQGSAGEANKYKDSILKIADSLKKGDKAGAEKLAAATAKKNNWNFILADR